MKKIRAIKPVILFLLFSMFALDATAWWIVVDGIAPGPIQIYFLGVSAASSELIIFPKNLKILIDAGPDQKILAALAKAMPQDDTSIDLAVISTPEAKHFGGYDDILDHYRVGAFLYDGRNPLDGEDSPLWNSLLAKIAALRIPLITAGAEDQIVYGTNRITFLSPDRDFGRSGSLADATLVELVKTNVLTMLFASDAGTNVEKNERARFGDIHVDILQGNAFGAAIHSRITTSSKSGGTTEFWSESDRTGTHIVHVKTL